MTCHKPTTFLLLALLAACTFTFAQPLLEPTPSPEILCNVNELSEICPAIYDPVCVPAPKNCFTTPCYQYDNYPNKCQACNAPGVLSYIPGECQYKCEPLNLPPPALDTIDNPVCASYQEDCQDSSCRQTFSRSTIACQDPKVVSFSLGACSEDDWEGPTGENNEEECSLEEECLFEEEHWDEECTLEEEFGFGEGQINEIVLYCGGQRPEICRDIYSPVCVTECRDGECRRTAANTCDACSDLNVVAYTPGACEAERIQCPVQDLSATDIFCTMEYAPVCGYSSDCTEEPCGTTAGNACEACSFQGKDYYIRGTCEGTPF